MTGEIIALRLVHILGAILWVGSGLFTSFFLMPALAGAGPAAGQVMAGLQRRRLFTALPIVAVLTMLSGLRLMWLTSGGFSPAYFASTMGRTYAASGLAAIVAFLLSLLVARPAAVRASGVAMVLAGAPDDAARARLAKELEGLRSRTAAASIVAVALLIGAAGGMAIARYLA